MPTNLGPAAPRDPFLDYLKGALIYLVCLGHVIEIMTRPGGQFWADPVHKAIYTFHMPLFLAISGFLSYRMIHRTAWADVAARRAGQLLRPAVAWTALTAVFLAASNGDVGPRAVLRWGEVAASGLWFLWVLYAAAVAVAILRRAGADGVVGLSVAAALSLALPPAVPMATVFQYAFPFFAAGYLAYRYRGHRFAQAFAASRPAAVAATVAAAAAWAACLAVWTPHSYVAQSGMSVRHRGLLLIALRDAAAVAGSCVAIAGLAVLFRLGLMRRTLAAWGRGSLDVYVMQWYAAAVLVKLPLPWEGDRRFSWTVAPVAAAAMTVALVWAGLAVERVRWAGWLMFGRRWEPAAGRPVEAPAEAPPGGGGAVMKPVD